MLERSSPRNCKMTFTIGRGFTKCQILKMWKWPYLLSRVEYFDKLLHKHWHWQDLAQEIAKRHFLSAEALSSSNSEKVKVALSLELWRILWWNFAFTILTRCSLWYFQIIFGICRDFAEVQILKKWNWPYPSIILIYFDKILHTHYYWHDLDRGIAKSSPRDCKMTFNIGRGCAELQILKKWKWPYLLSYWRELDRGIAKCHLLFMKFCIIIDIDKI